MSAVVLTGLLAWEAGMYLAAPAYSLLGIRGEDGARPAACQVETRAQAAFEGRAARLALAPVLSLLLGAGAFQWMPTWGSPGRPQRAP